MSARARMGAYLCSTCELVREHSGGFNDLTPSLEAFYVEHLKIEHGLEP